MKPGRRSWNRPQRLRATPKNRHTASAAVPLALALIAGGMAIGYAHKRLTAARRTDPIASAAGAAVLPFQKGTSATQGTLTSALEALFRGGALQQENHKLSASNDALKTQVAGLRKAAAEARRLRAQLDYIEAQQTPPALCEVVAWLPSSVRNTITIASKPGAGIVRDAAVVNADGLIGHVIETEALRAQVLLLSDPDSHFHSQIVRGDKVIGTGVVSGNGKGNLLKLESLKPESPVRKGDRVVTSGEGGKFPQGIYIGWIETVRGDNANFDRSATVKPATPPDALHEVLVLR